MPWNDEVVNPTASYNPTSTVIVPGGLNSTVTNFNSTGAATILAANKNRKLLGIFNEGAGNLYVKLGDTPSTTSYTVQLVPNAYYETDRYAGIVTGLFSAAGNARVTEVTA